MSYLTTPDNPIALTMDTDTEIEELEEAEIFEDKGPISAVQPDVDVDIKTEAGEDVEM